MLREKIEELLLSTGREGMENLLTYMRVNSFYSAPCSSKFHLCKEEGLAIHSLNTYETLEQLDKGLNANLPEDSKKIVGLLHDVGKMGFKGKANYIPNILKSGKRSEAEPYKTNSELLGIPHEVASIQIISQFIELTEDEVWSILMHNGLYTPTGYAVKGKETKLYLLLHTADMYTSRFCED